MRYPRSLPDTPEAKSWWEGAYAYFKEHGTKKGYPPLELPNGEKIDLHYTNNASKVDVEKGTGLKLRPKAQQSKDATVRKGSLKQQTYGDTKLADTKTPKGFNDHHVRPRGLYQQFFEGLNETDSIELARYSEQDLLMPLGDHPANNARIPDPVHDNHHAFARSHSGLERGVDLNRFKGFTLEQRKEALKLFKENIQPALDEDLFKQMQGYKLSSPLLSGTARKVLLRSLGLVPLMGATANAVDAAERTQLAAETNDPLDKLQAGIATTSVASTGWAEPIGFAADVGNTLIDVTRWLSSPFTRQQLKQGASRSFTGANTGRY